MYLKQLYHHNKFWFAVIVLFALLQVINNVRQDIAISPVYSYGMYSEKISPAESYTVTEIFVNGKQLTPIDFTPQQWDNISLPVSMYQSQADWNLAVWQQDIHRLLPFADSVHYVNDITDKQFNAWYKLHLQSVLGYTVDTVNIQFNKYLFNGSVLIKQPAAF